MCHVMDVSDKMMHVSLSTILSPLLSYLKKHPHHPHQSNPTWCQILFTQSLESNYIISQCGSHVVRPISLNDPLQIQAYGCPFLIFNHITMNWYSTLVINYYELITTQGYESYLLNNMCGGYNQNYFEHMVYHSPPIKIIPMYLR